MSEKLVKGQFLPMCEWRCVFSLFLFLEGKGWSSFSKGAVAGGSSYGRV